MSISSIFGYGNRLRMFIIIREELSKWNAKYKKIILTKNVSAQWAHVTLHIPGTEETGGVTGLGAKLIIRLQFGRGQAIRCDELLQMSKQLHGHLTYFLPGGAFRMGYKYLYYLNFISMKIILMMLTVASLHWLHLTTCCSLFCVMSIIAWHTRHVTIGTPPVPGGTW